MNIVKMSFHYNLSQEVTLKCASDKPGDKKKKIISIGKYLIQEVSDNISHNNWKTSLIKLEHESVNTENFFFQG